MTREQAINYLISSGFSEEQVSEVVRALTHEPTIKNDSPKYCDRSICLKNEYNNVGCEDCEVIKSQEPTTKNDLGVDCQYTDEEIAKSFIEDVEAVKDQLPIKNNLGVASGLEKNSKKLEKDFGELDCISRKQAIKRLNLNFPSSDGADNSRNRHRYMQALADIQAIREMPSVTPQEPRKGHWILTDVEGNRVWHCNCSECGKDPQNYIGGSENWWLIKSKLPKFCPNCGSDNREEEK